MAIPEEAKILLLLGSGNRDEEMFANGESFDIHRPNAKRNLGLGLGAHFCMGAPLARMEMRVILEELSQRLPGLRLVENQQWKFVPTLAFRGTQELHVEWDR